MFGFGRKKQQPSNSQSSFSPQDIEAIKRFQALMGHMAPEPEAPRQPAPEFTENVTTKVVHAVSGNRPMMNRKRRVIAPNIDEGIVAGEEADSLSQSDEASLGNRINILRSHAKGDGTGNREDEQGIGITETEGRMVIADEVLHPKKQWQDVITISPPHVIQPFTIATSLDQIEPIVVAPRVLDSSRRDYLNWLKRMTNGSGYSAGMKEWLQTHNINLDEFEKEIEVQEQESQDFDPDAIKREDLPYYKNSTKNGKKDSGVENFIYRHDRRMMSFKGESQKNALEILETKASEEDESLRRTNKF